MSVAASDDAGGLAGRIAPLYLPYLEGLRGITALYVVFYHTWFFTTQVNAAALLAIPFGGRFFSYGHYAVGIFIVLSGYCLTLPVAGRPNWPLRGGLVEFARRRALRLLPAYYAGLALSIVLFVVWLLADHRKVHPIGIAIGTLTHAFLIHNLSNKTLFYINAALWSVALELQIYVGFAIALLPIARRFGVGAMLGFALIVGLAPHFVLHHFLDFTYPWFFALFAFGVAAAAINCDGRPSFVRLERVVPWGAATIVALLATIAFVATEKAKMAPGDAWSRDLSVGLTVALFLIYARAREKAGSTPAIVRALATPGLVWLGTFSYSLYLIHHPVVRLTTTLLARAHLAPALQFGLETVVVVPIIVGVSALFYRVFERPYIASFRRRAEPALARVAEGPRALAAPTTG